MEARVKGTRGWKGKSHQEDDSKNRVDHTACGTACLDENQIHSAAKRKEQKRQLLAKEIERCGGEVRKVEDEVEDEVEESRKKIG